MGDRRDRRAYAAQRGLPGRAPAGAGCPRSGLRGGRGLGQRGDRPGAAGLAVRVDHRRLPAHLHRPGCHPGQPEHPSAALVQPAAAAPYAAQSAFTPPGPGAPAVSFNRGWASIDGQLPRPPLPLRQHPPGDRGLRRGAAIQEAQAAELLAGPAFGRGADLVVGDFNSAADGSTTATYGLLTDRLRDAWSVRRGAGLHLLPGADARQPDAAVLAADRPDPGARGQAARGPPGRRSARSLPRRPSGPPITPAWSPTSGCEEAPQLKALSPVSAWPMTSWCTSEVPS